MLQLKTKQQFSLQTNKPQVTKMPVFVVVVVVIVCVCVCDFQLLTQNVPNADVRWLL